MTRGSRFRWLAVPAMTFQGTLADLSAERREPARRWASMAIMIEAGRQLDRFLAPVSAAARAALPFFLDCGGGRI